MLKYIPAIIFAIPAVICLLIAIIPTKGGASTAGLLIFPAGGFAIAAVVAGVLAYFL